MEGKDIKETLPKTENLSIGMKIKNHKTLCDLLGVEYKSGGKSRQLQIQYFQRYFTFIKQGQAYIIDEIYETPIPKEDKRADGNNSIYLPYMVKVLQYLIENEEFESQISLNKIAKIIDMFDMDTYYFTMIGGKNFNRWLHNHKIMNRFSIPLKYLANNLISDYRGLIASAMNRLEKKGFINIERTGHINDRHVPLEEFEEMMKIFKKSKSESELQALNDIYTENSDLIYCFPERKDDFYLDIFDKEHIQGKVKGELDLNYLYMTFTFTVLKRVNISSDEFEEALHELISLTNQRVRDAVDRKVKWLSGKWLGQFSWEEIEKEHMKVANALCKNLSL